MSLVRKLITMHCLCLPAMQGMIDHDMLVGKKSQVTTALSDSKALTSRGVLGGWLEKHKIDCSSIILSRDHLIKE